MPRLIAGSIAAVLATAAVTFAAGRPEAAGTTPANMAATPAKPTVLVVPDVRRQAYVFAKGTLEDGGFAWRVVGGVRGYAANVVVAQQPTPGSRVIDTGEPLVSLTLGRNGRYREKGTPEDASPYAGTPIRSADLGAVATPAKPAKAKPKKAVPAKATKPKQATPKKPRKPAAKAKPAATTPTKKTARYQQKRPVAFVVPGARAEPLDEMPLPDRARKLGAWLAGGPLPTNRNVRYFLYQNAWVVTGARFGWWRGAQALEILIAADGRAFHIWGVGARSAAFARKALAEVRAKSR